MEIKKKLNAKLKARKYDFIILIILLIASIKFVFRIEYVLDIGLYDESSYLYRGINAYENGLPVASSAPLYAIWYYVLSLIEPDRVELYYLNFKILMVLLTMLIYTFLRRCEQPQIVAILISFFFLISAVNLRGWPKVSHFAVVLVFCSFILASFTKRLTSTFMITCIGALLSSYVRPEYFIAYLLLLLMYGGLLIVEVKNKNSKSEIFNIVLLGLSSLLIISKFGMPIGGNENRSWIAFGQHFSLNWVKWTGSDLDPWINWENIISQNFGAVESISTALISNPSLFIQHMTSNLVGTVKLGLFWFSSHSNVIFPDGTQFDKVERYLLIIISVLYILSSSPQWMPRVKSNLKKYGHWFFIFACYAIPAFASTIIIFPQDHYLLLLGLLLIIVTCFLVAPPELESKLNSYYGLAIIGTLIICLVPYTSYKHSESRTNFETINLINSLDVKTPVNLLEAEGGFYIYTGNNFRRVAEYHKETGFTEFMTLNEINMIVVSKRLKKSSQLKNDKEWQDFLSRHAEYGYQSLVIPNTDRELIVDLSLLE